MNYSKYDELEHTPINDQPKLGNSKKKHIKIEELMKDYDGKYVSEEIDWGMPVGKEVRK